ncbi:MAG: hypothetical protein FWG77_03650 [Treponema sp.]|nr:hypothetical protein [Treponema sp.]
MEKDKIHKHIRTERMEIVEPDGTVRLSLFNSKNIPPALMDNEDILPGHRQDTGMAGIMFYNSEGDESGGLLFSSEKRLDGGYNSGLSMTFDQYKNDQVVQVLLDEDEKGKTYGFRVFDRNSAHIKDTVALSKAMKETDDPEKKKEFESKLKAQNVLRMHAGKDRDGSVGVNLYDKQGKQRIRLYIDNDDMPRFEIFDAEGNVKHKLQ